MDTTKTLCSETVASGTSRWPTTAPCKREAVEDGLCRVHLAVKRRRKEKAQQWREKDARNDALLAEAKELSSALGIEVQPEWLSREARYSETKAVVPLEWLRRLAKDES